MSEAINRTILKGCEGGQDSKLPQDSQQRYSPEVTFHRKSRPSEEETAVKDYQKEVPRKLRFQALNRNVEHAPIHKVSRSCSPKNSEISLELNEEDIRQSNALQKKRERYHSQRRSGERSKKLVLVNKASKPNIEEVTSSQKPTVKHSSNQFHHLGKIYLQL